MVSSLPLLSCDSSVSVKKTLIKKKVNTQWSSEIPTCKLMKKVLLHIFLHVFCLHVLRIHHDYFFQRVFENVRAEFLSGNISGLLVIYLFNYNSSKSTPCWRCNWTFSWVQFLSNKLKLIRFLRCKITRTSFFLLMLCVLICTFL